MSRLLLFLFVTTAVFAQKPHHEEPGGHHRHHDRSQDAFQHGKDLVAFIKRFNESGGHPDPRGFGIGP